MEKNIALTLFCSAILICFVAGNAGAQAKPAKQKVRYDTIIVKHVTKAPKKAAVVPEIILPVPEFINQAYYFDKGGNKLIKLENADALLVIKKKTLGLKGAKQSLSMDAGSSKIRFVAKKEIVFLLRQAAM